MQHAGAPLIEARRFLFKPRNDTDIGQSNQKGNSGGFSPSIPLKNETTVDVIPALFYGIFLYDAGLIWRSAN